MHKLAISALFVGALGVFACGGGDGAISPRDAEVMVACNSVAQTGCDAGLKCAQVEVAVDLYVTGCVTDGTRRLGEVCVQGEPGEDTGFDDCAAGFHCLAGTCREICSSSPNSCVAFACSSYTDVFKDRPGTGVCAPYCDPVVQDCASATDGCYLNYVTGESICLVPGPTEELHQDDPCLTPEGESGCHINGCNRGYAPNSAAQSAMSSVCVKLCTPTPQYIGNSGNLQGDPAGVTCTLDVDPNMTDSHECRYINTFYSNTTMVPSTIGFCINRENWYMGGTCATVDLNDLENTFVPGCLPFDFELPGMFAPAAQGTVFPGDVEALMQMSEELLQQSITRQ